MQRITRVFLTAVLAAVSLTVAGPSKTDAVNAIFTTWGPGHSNTTRSYWLTPPTGWSEVCGFRFVTARVDISLGTVTASSAYVKQVKYTWWLPNGESMAIQKGGVITNSWTRTWYSGDGFGFTNPVSTQYWGYNVYRTLYQGSGYYIFRLWAKFRGCPFSMEIDARTSSQTPT